MALAQRQAGVTQGYKPKAQSPLQARAQAQERREPALLQRAVKSLLANAREMREFVLDEIVYATIDTIHVARYLKYQLGFRKRNRVEPILTAREPSFQTGTLQVEPVRIFAER